MLLRMIPAAVFISMSALHFVYVTFLKTSGCEAPTALSYLTSGDVFTGFSFAVSGAFTVWSLRRFLCSGSISSAAGTAGGTALLAGIGAAGCFFSGCCGSPMLIVYANILGIHSLQMPKWVMAFLTVVSVGLGWWWLTRKDKEGCRCSGSAS